MKRKQKIDILLACCPTINLAKKERKRKEGTVNLYPPSCAKLMMSNFTQTPSKGRASGVTHMSIRWEKGKS